LAGLLAHLNLTGSLVLLSDRQAIRAAPALCQILTNDLYGDPNIRRRQTTALE
jgi:hypothetical protein